MSLFPFSRLLPYMFRAFISPSSGVSQAVVYMQLFGSRVSLLIVCVHLRTGLWWCLHSEDTTTNQSAGARRRSTKTRMNQMVAYKQQLEIPLMAGL
jgi:hypothetical protein